MERAVDLLRDASSWVRSKSQEDWKEKWEPFKKRDPIKKPEAVWSKTKEPEIIIETEPFEKKKGNLEENHEEFDFTKAREKLCEKFDAVIAISAEIKSKFRAKLLRDTASRVDLEREESSGHESDFDSEYEIVELHEHIVFIGGAAEDDQGSEPAAKVEVFDVAINEWQEIAPLPVKTTACYATAITGIPGLIVIGGFGGWKALNTIQMYDWVTKEWRILKHMRKRRWGCYATGTDHGIVVAGGCDQGSVLNSVELYNAKKEEWFTLPPMLEQRCNFAGAIIDRKLLVAGGGSGFYFNSAKHTAEMFDGAEGKWKKLPSMRHKRYGCAAVAWKKKMIVVGGCDRKGVDILNVEVFDPEGHVWLDFPPLPQGFSLCRAHIVQNKLLVFGADGGENASHAYAFDFELNSWQKDIELPRGRNAFAVAVIGV
ncbi:kelch-like protein 3 [Montipora capricornis]|uniref:kelch-like protein 3 n=1 Tax=Montipora capricornis TaxID=246305 RepID=UPI0035F21577